MASDIDYLTIDELDQIESHLDDETEWSTINEFWECWGPRLSDRLRRLIKTARRGALPDAGEVCVHCGGALRSMLYSSWPHLFQCTKCGTTTSVPQARV